MYLFIYYYIIILLSCILAYINIVQILFYY